MSASMGYLQVVCCLLAVTPAVLSAEVLFQPSDLDFGSVDGQLSTFERKFFLHSKDHPEGVELELWRLPYYLKSDTETKVITHGYRESRENLQALVDEYLKVQDVNVVTFSWENLGNASELRTCLAAIYFGRFIVGIFLRLLTTRFKVKPEQIHLIGSDMGAHLMGSAARFQPQKIARVTGLNPHGKYSDGTMPFKIPRLSAQDAMFVDVYHTSHGPLGLTIPIGTVDFYPNGGKLQPQCTDDGLGMCSSHMAKKYFAESIEFKDNFWGVKCSSYEAFKSKQCNDNPVTVAGEFGNATARGTFFFQTNANSPYGKQKSGARAE